MDLVAYMQIDDLSELLNSTGITIPRLRGLRLMSNEKRIPESEIKKLIKQEEVAIIEQLCRSFWNPNSGFMEYSSRTDYITKYYISHDQKHIKWNKIHGKKRKMAKYALKKNAKNIRASLDTFNKYAGSKDVLYVHARIGGNNWKYYQGDKIAQSPAYIEHVDDWLDDTYCDIYLKIDEK